MGARTRRPRSHTLLLAALLSFVAAVADASFFYKDFSLYSHKGEQVASLHPPIAHNTMRSCRTEEDLECLRWGEDDNLFRVRKTRAVGASICVGITIIINVNLVMQSCWNLSNHHWYGGGEERQQLWPLSQTIFSKPVVSMATENRALTAPLWLSSGGDVVFVDRGAPVFLEMNAATTGEICFSPKNFTAPFRKPPAAQTKYTLHYCKHENARDALEYAMKNFLSRPSVFPDADMIRYPMWSTRGPYGKDVNESAVRELAEGITAHGFKSSQLEVAEGWESCLGSMLVDKNKFSNPSALFTNLRSKGHRVVLWRHPFVKLTCDAEMHRSDEDGLFVKGASGSTSTSWQGQPVEVYDLTTGWVRNIWLRRHQDRLNAYGVAGFTFDAGEVSWLPELPQLAVLTFNHSQDYPGEFTGSYVRTAAQVGGTAVVKAGHYTQDLSVFVRMADKDSRWGYDNGLKSLVTTLLHMNVVGYRFVLPDVVGGNQRNGDVITGELFVRWLQAVTFMPAIQFSVTPWSFKNETILELSRKFVTLHERYAGSIREAINSSITDGTPVNPPIWWINPLDETAQIIDSEFLLGEYILVAPVMEEKASTRDIYLPSGMWEDGNTGETHHGPGWLRGYVAPLDTLPFFLRNGYQPPSDGNTATALYAAVHVLGTGLLLILLL